MVDFQCAVAARERDEPMFATASQVRRWLLIEVRGAWGRDAVADSDLARHVTAGWKRRMRDEGIRVVAIRRDLDRTTERALELFYVDSGDSTRPGECWRRPVGTLHGAVDATTDLPGAAGAPPWQPHRRPLALVCTNGRHDACCATFGRPLARVMRQDAGADDVWECSHIGGDRFAGNLVILPAGLYFGRCDGESGPQVLDAYRRGEIHLESYRGRSVLGFFEQAAEFFVRRELGLTSIDAVSAVRRIGEMTGAFAVDVVTTDERRTVRVAVARTEAAAPAPITCSGPIGLRVPSYRLVSIDG